MKSPYQEAETAKNYLAFLNSYNGQIQREILSGAILARLGSGTGSCVLDAACGPGWLVKILNDNTFKAEGCDISQPLIEEARQNYLGATFKIADILEPLPYPADSFEAVVLNMAGPDINNLAAAYKNIFAIIKPDGRFLMTIPNPAYTFPVGVWKRSLLDFAFGRKPKLILLPLEQEVKKIHREFNKGQTIESNFYSLSDYLTAAESAGFKLVSTEELRSKTDSKKFDLNYQMYRYPLILLLEFNKTFQ